MPKTCWAAVWASCSACTGTARPRGQALAALGLDQYGGRDEALSTDEDAVLLDYFEPGGRQQWTLAVTLAPGPGGVWVPDDCLRYQLDDDEADGKDQRDY